MIERDKRKVRAHIKRGLTVPEIAKKMRGVSQQSIYRLIQKEDLPMRKMRGSLPKDVREIKRMVAKLESVEAVATHYGVTRSAVYYRLSQGS